MRQAVADQRKPDRPEYGCRRIERQQLWQKVRGVRSAGREQSVSLRLSCAREAEIEVFEPSEYWTVNAGVAAEGIGPFAARLTRLVAVSWPPLDLAQLNSSSAYLRPPPVTTPNSNPTSTISEG